jgi:hypothetical protein
MRHNQHAANGLVSQQVVVVGVDFDIGSAQKFGRVRRPASRNGSQPCPLRIPRHVAAVDAPNPSRANHPDINRCHLVSFEYPVEPRI